MRLTVLLTHPIQYYSPLFRRLSEFDDMRVHVVYLTDSGIHGHNDPGFGREVKWDVPLLEGYRSEILRPGVQIQNLSPLKRHSDRLIEALQRSQPDFILVFGYASRMNWSAVRFARKRGVRIIYMSDSNHRLMRKGVKLYVKKFGLANYFSAVDIFLSCGEANFSYLKEMGADDSRIVRCPFSIDAQRFRPPESPSSPTVDFVWAGKLIGCKRPLDFLEGLRTLVAHGLYPRARLIGTGPLEPQVLHHGSDLVKRGVLEFRGFANQSQMPAELHAGRAFVFTSDGDAYGLAVTEAVAAELPIISADVNGCVGSWSSAQPNRNALIYPAGNVPELARNMERLLLDNDLRERLKRESAIIGPGHDSSAAAKIIHANMKAASNPPRL